MKTTHWFVMLPVIILVVIGVLLSKNEDAKVGEVPVVESSPEAATTLPASSTKVLDTQFTLQTITDQGKLAFQGVGGEIDGIVNPDLHVKQGAIVKITLINADGMPHNVFFPDFKAQSGYVAKIGEQTELVFEVGTLQSGSYVYYCEVPGHRRAGQEGQLVIAEP